MLFLLTGCASAPPALYSLRPGSSLAVLQLPDSVGDRQLLHVLHADEKSVLATTLAADRRDLDQSLQTSLIAAFARSPDPTLAAADFIPVEPDWQGMAIGQPLDAATLARLRAQHPADAYLRLRVTDYGQTPARWKTADITFEVVSTLAIGGLLYIHKATRPLAGVYLLQEGIEEYSEGYAGWWLFNRLSRPVRVEADLVDGRSGAVLWQDADTGLAGWQWGHLWRMDDATRRALLQISTAQAAGDLSIDLGGP